MKSKHVMILGLVFILALATAGTALAINGTGTVTVVHGVPGLTVDVYVNGALALPGFEPGTVTEPLEMPTGDYDIAIVPAGQGNPDNPVIEGSATVTEGLNASIVAHLAEDGTPTLSVFVNDVSAIEDDTARLVVRHTAAAPTVDVALYDDDGDLVGVLEGLSNPNETQLEVPEDDYQVAIFPAGGDTPVFGPVEIDLEDEESHIFYAIGSLTGGTFTVLKQTIELDELDDDRGQGVVTVVHGVPGLTVDVYVNNVLALPGFEPGTVTDPLELPVGDYNIVIVPEGGDPNNPVIEGSATITEGLNASVVAHLTESGDPTLSVFVNDLSAIEDDTARLVVRHTAAAPTVDVALYDDDGDLLGVLEDLSNPNEAQLEVPEDDYQVAIFPAGGDTPVFGPVEIDLEDEESHIFYAIGSLNDGTFQVLKQEIELDETHALRHNVVTSMKASR